MPFNFNLTFASEDYAVADSMRSLGVRTTGPERRQDGRLGVPRADRGGVRRARLDSEVGLVSSANAIGLILAVLIALLLGAALVFPERF